MGSPETNSQFVSELPSAERAEWHDFLDPHKAIENFKKMLHEIGEVI
jgi:hypothetical protein